MAAEYRNLHQNAVGGIAIRRDDIGGTPYGEMKVKIGRDEVAIHMNAATLMSVAAGLIEMSKELQFGRGTNEAADHANVRTPNAQAV